MNKVIILSVRPEWLAKIMNGKKTIEIRKVVPTWALEEIAKGNPVDIYCYCTKSTGGRIAMNKPYLYMSSTDHNFLKHCGADIYILSQLRPIRDILNGLIPCKFTMKKTEKLDYKYFENNSTTADAYAQAEIFVADFDEPKIEKESCLGATELWNYLGKKGGYAWHIDDLVIFDKPMELREFYGILNDPKCIAVPTDPLKRAPQSWQYAYLESGK